MPVRATKRGTARTPLAGDFDVLICGASFAGLAIARELRSTGARVLVVDRRPHIGGNAYDARDAAGILIHPYGPHIFHTNAQAILDYLSRFTAWRPYEHRVLAEVRGGERRSGDAAAATREQGTGPAKTRGPCCERWGRHADGLT